MSWFDATGLANIAKSALKEAQKTIDKALDIRDDEKEANEDDSRKKTTRSDFDNEFFSAWGLNEGKSSDASLQNSDTGKKKGSTLPNLTTSSWGSFTGSFFEVGSFQSNGKQSFIFTQPQKYNLGLHTDGNGLAPLASPESELTPIEGVGIHGSDSKFENDVGRSTQGHSLATANSGFELKECEGDENILRELSSENDIRVDGAVSLDVDEKVITRQKSMKNINRNNYATNRLSAVSTESEGKKSCDSVEVIGSLSSTTSPDADVPSVSTSSSLGLPMSISATDSVEVINTTASPSSIEVLESNCSGRSTQLSNINFSGEDGGSVSGYSKELIVVSPSNIGYRDASPESVEVLPEMNELDDELSVADSYTSVSESTGTTVVEPLLHYSYREQRILPGSDAIIANYSSRSKSTHGSPIKNLISKSEEQRTVKPDLLSFESLNSHDRKETDEESLTIFNSDRSDSISLEEICCSSSSHSDTKTLIANDSSREGTLMESSAEDAATLKLTGSDKEEFRNGIECRRQKIQVKNSSCSFYVKNLLADAMGEGSLTRETSPTLSEKSRSDLVKVGSEQTSEHTSGDELETTTSSDIEIISRYSPNGDSSSTTSRHSPSKLMHYNSKGKLSLVAVDILGKVTQTKAKGHQREPSEASSFCSEDNSVEMEKLSKRIAELTEMLADRESKLIDLGRCNLEVLEKNEELKKKVEQIKSYGEARLSCGLLDAEKDDMIKQLREEGDKLSKKELKQANLIKTLRAQEKSQQATIEKNKIEILSLKQELEKIKATLLAKEDSEKIQRESINQLTNKINRQDKEIANLLDEMEKAVVKAEHLNIALERTESELDSYKEKLVHVEGELLHVKSVAEAKGKKLDIMDDHQLKIEMELEYTRQQLKKSEDLHTERENYTKEEKSNLIRRIQEAEGRNEELTQSVSHATKPLLRQMEALQATIAHERETWEKQERTLVQKLNEMEVSLSSAQYYEKIHKQEVAELCLKVNNLEFQLQEFKDAASSREEIQTLERQLEAATQAYKKEMKNAEKLNEKIETDLRRFKNEIATLEQQLSVERNAAELERRKVNALQEQLREREIQQSNRGDSNSSRSSPTLSFGRGSLSESLSSNWPQFSEDTLETLSTSGRCANVYENMRMGNATSLIEGLQSQLKMREGELMQLQWELQRRDTERLALTNEVSTLTTKVEELETALRENEAMDRNLKELQTNYDALLEMYGEKVEEADELRMDLADVKDMYKTQIDQLLQKENQQLSQS